MSNLHDELFLGLHRYKQAVWMSIICLSSWLRHCPVERFSMIAVEIFS